MIYLASPYAHEDSLVMKTRFLLAEQVTAHFLKNKVWVYSPIVHNHQIGLNYNLEFEHSDWMAFDLDMLRRCESLYVLAIPGWKESRGVGIEIDIATRLSMHIDYVNEEGKLVWPA